MQIDSMAVKRESQVLLENKVLFTMYLISMNTGGVMSI